MEKARKLTGDRIYLGPMDVADAPLYSRWLMDMELAANLNAAAMVFGVEDEEKWIRENVSKQIFRIGLLEDDRTIGNVGIPMPDQLNGTGEIGIFIGEKELLGQGYGTEAMALIMGYAFEILNMESIWLRVFPWNSRAIASYRKLGFKDAGVLRRALKRHGRSWDEPLMDITREEFMAGEWARFAPPSP